MSENNEGIIVILSSPSGAGKTTLVKEISKGNNFQISISHTTRKPRPNEIDGKDYYFVSKSEFKNLIDKDKFLEYAKVFKHYYGSSKDVVIKNTQSFISIVSSKIDNYQRPIIFYEQYMADEYHPDEEAIKLIEKKNNALKNQIEKQINNGFKNLFLIGQNGCISEDSEATVDVVNFNDLGFLRFANHFITEFKKLDINI